MQVIKLLISGLLLSTFLFTAKAEEAAESKRIDRLIEQLGDADYFVRERAQQELTGFSIKAFDPLFAAAGDENLEIAARAKYLLRVMRTPWIGKDDPPEVKRLLTDYEKCTFSTKSERIEELALLEGGRGVAALCRLVRYEKSPVLSRRAALHLIDLEPLGDPPSDKLAELLHNNLGNSRRKASAWLMTWLQFAEDPPKAIDAWSKLVDAELALLENSPSATTSEIATDLICFGIEWLEKLGRTEKARAEMHRLVDLEPGDPDSLAELLDWLIAKKAWKVADELAARFPDRFSSRPLLLYTLAGALVEQGDRQRAEKTVQRALDLNPGKESRQLAQHYSVARSLRARGMSKWARKEYNLVLERGDFDNPVVTAALTELLNWSIDQKAWKTVDRLSARFKKGFEENATLAYALARAQAERGDKQAAEKTAERAFKLNPGKESKQLQKHYLAARRLRGKGQFDWAEREYRYLIDTLEEVVPTVYTYLAEMLHDQEKELEAAKTLEELFEAMKSRRDTVPLDSAESSLRSRMNYFFSCDCLKKGDRAGRRAYLEKAIAADPTDADVLIALFHLEDQTPEQRKNTGRLIRSAAEKFRREIAAAPDSPTAYNQFAWLIGNTEGDFDEALRYSKKSLQLRPDSGGYLDTLAHVYFAKGDYEKAVTTQIKAVEQDPHTLIIKRKLEVFRKKFFKRKLEVLRKELKEQKKGSPGK